MDGSGVCVPPLCIVAGGLEADVEGVEVIRQAVCGADVAGGGPVVLSVAERRSLGLYLKARSQ